MATSMLDSKPVFVARMISSGVPIAYIDRLVLDNIDTLGRLAYCSSSVPASGDDVAFVTTVCKAIGKTEEEIGSGMLGAIRRVWYESHTVAVAEIKHKVESTGESVPRKLPIPERAARSEAQERRLAGVDINSRIEPSYSLCDFVSHMKEDEQLRYVSPEMCTSRESEIQGIKRNAFPNENKADVSNEFRARRALQRRSLALDQSDLMTYLESERYHDFLYDLIQQPVPASHFPITLHQILQVDKFLWGRMSEYCRKGISPRPNGERPMQLAMDRARTDPVVLAMMQPLPRPAGGGHSYVSEGSKGKGKGKDKNRNETVKRKSEAVDEPKKGKGKGIRDKFVPMPKPLVGLHARTKDNKRICFSFNLASGCDEASAGDECSKGAHVCCKCLGSHSFQACRS